MKRTIIAFILLCIVFAFCIFDNAYMTKTGARMLAVMDEMYSSCEREDSNTALAAAEKLSEYWDKSKALYLVLNNHEELEQTESGIEVLREYALRGDTAALRVQLASTRAVLENLMDKHIIKIENVF